MSWLHRSFVCLVYFRRLLTQASKVEAVQEVLVQVPWGEGLCRAAYIMLR